MHRRSGVAFFLIPSQDLCTSDMNREHFSMTVPKISCSVRYGEFHYSVEVVYVRICEGAPPRFCRFVFGPCSKYEKRAQRDEPWCAVHGGVLQLVNTVGRSSTTRILFANNAPRTRRDRVGQMRSLRHRFSCSQAPADVRLMERPRADSAWFRDCQQRAL